MGAGRAGVNRMLTLDLVAVRRAGRNARIGTRTLDGGSPKEIIGVKIESGRHTGRGDPLIREGTP